MKLILNLLIPILSIGLSSPHALANTEVKPNIIRVGAPISGITVTPPVVDEPDVFCAYAGPRDDGLPNYNGYSYHQIEYKTYNGADWPATLWFNNNYIGEFYPDNFAASGYSMGKLMHTPEDQDPEGMQRSYYEICETQD